jgi:hypothetical protein
MQYSDNRLTCNYLFPADFADFRRRKISVNLRDLREMNTVNLGIEKTIILLMQIIIYLKFSQL